MQHWESDTPLERNLGHVLKPQQATICDILFGDEICSLQWKGTAESHAKLEGSNSYSAVLL
jgi:hypothetical protein